MVKEADAAYRLIAPTSQTKESRHKSSLRGVKKIIKAGKPLVEHYFHDTRDSPNRTIPEKKYGKRETIRTKKGDHVKEKIKSTLDKVFDKNEERKENK